MSLIQMHGGTDTERQLSPGLTANFPSNNPFRNRAVSPANSLPSPVANGFSIPTTAPDRPLSRNPFLDQGEKRDSAAVRVRSASPPRGSSTMLGSATPPRPALNGHAAELFDNLNLNDGPTANGRHQDVPPPYTNRPPRSENVPPRPRHGMSGHHPSRSQDESKGPSHGVKARGAPQELDIFADPPEPGKSRHRMRRNSDSSIASKTLSPEDERKRRERRHREREARHRDRADGKSKPPTSSKSKKPSQRLDIIDSLDVTSIYGTGLFHHDGPFDACNPHRNRKGSQRAPMQAFAKDSKNNVLGGSGPINKNIDFAQFHGRGAEGFTDFSTSGAGNPLTEPVAFEPYAGSSAPTRMGPGIRPGIDRTSTFNANARVDHVHGEESMGLGTTTFLEGAPAARAAIQRRESETEAVPGVANGGGLGRKRSLAQKIRGISNARDRRFEPSGRITSPDGTHERTTTPTSPRDALSAGGMPKIKETNPFFYDYDEAYEKKGRTIQIAEERNKADGAGASGETTYARARAVSSPKRAPTAALLERRVTNDGTGGQTESNGGGGGFLNRVKSLKGGRRSRPERRE